MESLKIFDNFKFSDLNEDWIQSVWDAQFMFYNEPPDEYLMLLEARDIRLLLHESCIAVKAWLAEGSNRNDPEHYCPEISWNTLIRTDIQVRALLAVLGYIMKHGQRKEADEDSRQSCLHATNLYFVLLAVPGSSVFNVFHPNLYQLAVETLKINSERLQPPVKKCRRATSLNDFTISDQSINDNVLLPGEKEALIRNLNVVLCNLVTMLKSFWFKDNTQSLDITIHGLLEMTKIGNDCTDSQASNRQRGTLEASLLENAYLALQELCDSKHGPVKVTIMFIARYALPRLLCSHVEMQAKFVANIQEATINFLKELLHVHEKEAKTAIITLIQQLMVKCPDQLEARQKQAIVLMKLFGICKQNIILEAFRNLILLSHHNKISFRVFAQEIIGKLLIESFLLDYNITNGLKVKAKKVFFAVVLSRCMDRSSTVRRKAMAIIAKFTESSNEANKAIFQTMFEESDPNKRFLTFENLKEALSEDVDLLSGSNVLITMLTERIEDEKAMIRRSTLLILKNLILMFPSLTNEIVPLISRRCRDPMLTVRQFAVQVLSQLLERFPDDPQLLDEWVQTVLPQIFDIEVKVQEKVLENLQGLLLKRIVDVSTCTDNMANDLPWKILHTLTNMKMRKHLSKACNLWVKNGIITASAVKSIQFHIGTNNNTEAWILLAALAESTKLPDMNKYISNYKEIFEENDFHASLVLQVLRYSWNSLDQKVLECLCKYLCECLQQFKINFCLISICVDIVHSILQYLNPDKDVNSLEPNMLSLLRTSEMEVTKIFEKGNHAGEAAPNYLKALFTLGHVTLLCTYKISPVTLRILQGILLEWDALPEVIKDIEELQPSAVVILGQQAMRDREVAKEVVPIFGRLLRQETNLNSVIQVAVKINTAKALADICVRFTALVEPYLSDMCVSMTDSSPQVREAIMIIFIQLLLEDFIKIKGPFFFHLLTMLSDSDNMIRELTIFLIEERLLTKNKNLISQQFLQSMYHYNNYQSQQKVYKVYEQKMREKERNALTLPGKRHESKRRTIYDFMLDHLDPPGKIKLLVKITSQILGGTCVDTIDVTKEEGACVLKDALYVIGSDRLRLSSSDRHGDDDQQENEEPTVETPAANGINIIVEGMKKHGLEVLLPVLIKLGKKLAVLKSPLENDVKTLLLKRYLEYNKDQLSNILNEYPELEKEVEQFRKQVGDAACNDEEFRNEACSPSETNNRVTPVSDSDFPTPSVYPKVMLERISTPHLLNRKSTNTTSNSLLSPASSPSSWNVITSTPILPAHSFPQPGPSTSTPRSSRTFNFHSKNACKHVSKSKRLSTYFPNTKKLNILECKDRERYISEIEDDSESD